MLAAHLASPPALALEPGLSEPGAEVTLSYTSDVGCPAQGRFVEEVKARVRRPVLFGESRAAIRMVVTLVRGEDRALGRLEVVQVPNEPTRREFSAASCEEVGSALALVAALALDPNARTEPLPTLAAPPEAPAGTVVEPARAAAPPAPPPSAPAPPLTPRVPSPRPSPRPSETRYSFWLGPEAEIALGQAPRALGTVGLSAGARMTAQSLAPSIQLTPAWGKTGTTGPESERGSFTWAVGRLELCPLSARLSTGVRLDPCAAAELGRLTARGAQQAIDVPGTAERWWAAAGVTLALELRFGRWFARPGALALMPITRDRFVFRQADQDTAVHRAEPLVIGGSLAVGFLWGE